MSDSPQPIVLKCPVCSASFRGVPNCSRCGTDLSPLMKLAARAWRARRHCREALLAGDLDEALRWSAQSQRLHRTFSDS